MNLVKRSISLSGHQTSVALEPEFWGVLDEMAQAKGVTLAGLLRALDETRGGAAAGLLGAGSGALLGAGARRAERYTRRMLRIGTGGSSHWPFCSSNLVLPLVGMDRILRTTRRPDSTWPKAA